MAARRKREEELAEDITNERIKLSKEAAEFLKNIPSISMDELEKMCEQNPEEKAIEIEKMEEKNMKTTDSNVTVKKITEEMDELMTWAMKQAITSKTFLDMSEEDMICVKKVLKIFNDTLELANKYRDYCYRLEAKVDHLESKLDKVLAKLDEK